VDVLVRRARALGVEVAFGHEVTDLASVADADLVVLADGAGSRLRRSNANIFGTVERLGENMHIWLGTTRPFESFTFAFEETHGGWIWFHAYQHGPKMSTAIVECTRETWHRLGFDAADGDSGLGRLDQIFSRHLNGHKFEDQTEGTVPAKWSDFTTVSNRAWHHDNIVLLGDSARTAHFSIGSGTRLAFEDAIGLAGAIASGRRVDLDAALQSYEDGRRQAATSLQAAAAQSAAWFENVAHHALLRPVELGYSLRMRRDSRVAASTGVRHSSIRYQLHLATQFALGRAARRAASVTRSQCENLIGSVRTTFRPWGGFPSRPTSFEDVWRAHRRRGHA
jgi:anthraniloyl-CoA monooxygenase